MAYFLKHVREFGVAANAGLLCMSIGSTLGWTSPVMLRFRNNTEDNPLHDPITNAQEGWITSIIALFALFGSILNATLPRRVGPKRILLCSSLLFIVSFILLLFAHTLWIVYTARALQGIGAGISVPSITLYLGEIASDDCRGALGSLTTFFIIGGILFSYILGPYVSYTHFQICCLMLPVVFVLTFVFMPESPYYFAFRGRKNEGIKSLMFLRGQNYKTAEEEMSFIQETIDLQIKGKGSIFQMFQNHANRRALGICCGLIIFQQLSGTSAVTFNSQTIFDTADSNIDPAVASIILGFTQLAANFITPFFVERNGRRIILIISAAGMGVSLCLLGTFFYIHCYGDSSNIRWIPVPALIIFNLMYGFGFGPLPYAIGGEIFSSDVKTTALAATTSVAFLTAFLVTRWYPEVNAFGPFYAVWFFSGMCVLALFFVIFVVIETKGLNFQKIQNKLER